MNLRALAATLLLFFAFGCSTGADRQFRARVDSVTGGAGAASDAFGFHHRADHRHDRLPRPGGTGEVAAPRD